MRVTAVEVKTRAQAEEAGFKMVRSDQEKYSRALFDLEVNGRKVTTGKTCEQIQAIAEVAENLPTKPTHNKRRRAA